MKIKIIDLLNKIANNEEVPERIKYNDETFTIREEKDDYANQNYWFTDRFCLLDLNDEIEVIEDTPKKIEKIDFRTLNTQKEKNRAMKDTINKLIDEINNLKENN